MASNTHVYDPDEKEVAEIIRQNQEEAINKISNSDKTLAILLAGASNNGKSSVVSKVFGADVGIGLDGASTTDGIKIYECKEKRLSLYDTPGLEKRNNAETIQQLCQCKPDILWLVLNYGSSIEDEELNIPERFPHVPTIVILNKVDILQVNKLTDDQIDNFDSKEADLPEKLRKSQRLMAVRLRLNQWKSTTKANIQRILLMSLRNEMPTDQPIGVINLCQATWMNCDHVASITFTQAQEVWQGDIIMGSIGIITTAVASAIGSAWIPLPGSTHIFTASTQWFMLGALCKLWGMSGDNIKIFMNVMSRNVVPVLVSYGIGSTCSEALKLLPGIGSIVGGSASSYIAGTCTLVLGSLATICLKNIHDRHRKRTESELEQTINDYMKSDRFRIFLDRIKVLAKNPTIINRNDLTRLVQNA